MKQRQGRKLNQHSTFSSLSSSSSREKASAEREKTNREGKQPLAERRSFSTCCLRLSQRHILRKGKQNREEGKEKRIKQGEERRKRQATKENDKRTQTTKG
ncbi:hypothetical protein NC652_007820 [Populus alba x Populus x berolinensis]|nr:hypothetical protein NC652_007820 [Populus alba x Populus x berolinensis]